ncbi:MAG TPA: hypothetical protein VM389_00130 [Phycisphaerae bacterium]|nr:hypothetical protein [Phycisphaerae bacterium]
MRSFRTWVTCAQWVVMLALIAVTAWMIASDKWQPPPASPASAVPASSLSEILSEPDGKLARRDIAELNLLAATGLHGVEAPEASAGMKMLDEWAGIVRRESQRRLKASASESQPSEATGSRLAATVLAEALRDQVGLNLLGKGSRDVDFRLPANVFIHGCLNGRKASSLSGPVVYVAVGRRLGYPLELAMAGATAVVRWHDAASNETFNIDFRADQIRFPPDLFYAADAAPAGRMPVPRLTKFRPLDRKGELAYFLSLRGRCLAGAGQLQDAQVAFAQAHRLVPEDPLYLAQLGGAVQAELGGQSVAARGARRSPAAPPAGIPDPMADIERIMRMNRQVPGMPGQRSFQSDAIA